MSNIETKTNYEVHFVGFGTVNQSRCKDAEKHLNTLASRGSIISVQPFTLPSNGPTAIGGNGRIIQQGPRIIPGLLVVLAAVSEQ